MAPSLSYMCLFVGLNGEVPHLHEVTAATDLVGAAGMNADLPSVDTVGTWTRGRPLSSS